MGTQGSVRLEPSLPRAAYWDPGFFAREGAAVFLDQWVCVARCAELPQRGDYLVVDLAGESVILIRGEGGELRAHLNLCRHRGSRLLCGRGNTGGAIRCPYHAWAYALDGRLVASPFVAPQDVPEPSRRLHDVAVDEWGGFVFVHATPAHVAAGATLAKQLGAIPEHVRNYHLEDLRTGATLRYDVAANWKVLLENYNECYHCAGVHPELCRLVPAFKDHGGSHLDWNEGIPHRESATTFTFSGTTTRAPFPDLNAQERTRHKGELIYPNLMLSLSADHVAAFTLTPRAPDRTEIVCDFLFHPSEIEKPGFDPSDAVAFWDLVNRQDWAICESVQAGMRSRAFTHGYYAPMEDYSLDIRRYIAARMGEDAVRIEQS
ncbi:MAG TPA: aromatic ring-hydroxylating dioxygenase subunit alpha [Candidatus Acidoferrales bacterium]|nr:aromatic ring-hydroxylating dioxygenase subunit alpha [Candidatus Acidoferrales bacterium]